MGTNQRWPHVVLECSLFEWCVNRRFSFRGSPIQLRVCGVAFLLHHILVHGVEQGSNTEYENMLSQASSVDNIEANYPADCKRQLMGDRVLISSGCLAMGSGE